jgi:hypothetical protein
MILLIVEITLKIVDKGDYIWRIIPGKPEKTY